MTSCSNPDNSVTPLDLGLCQVFNFWIQHGPDPQCGGFYGTLDRLGTSIDPTSKTIIQLAGRRHGWWSAGMMSHSAGMMSHSAGRHDEHMQSHNQTNKRVSSPPTHPHHSHPSNHSANQITYRSTATAQLPNCPTANYSSSTNQPTNRSATPPTALPITHSTSPTLDSPPCYSAGPPPVGLQYVLRGTAESHGRSGGGGHGGLTSGIASQGDRPRVQGSGLMAMKK